MNDKPATPSLTPDQLAAHEFLSELRTRITIQPLPYQDGVEDSALKSLHGMFELARATLKKYPGCRQFADVVTNALNVDLRPVTAKWHRAAEDRRLTARDGAEEFRADLEKLQTKLQDLAEKLHQMAYQSAYEHFQADPVMTKAALEACFKDVVFGIPEIPPLIDSAKREQINASEADAIKKRRAFPNGNPTGPAPSGGLHPAARTGHRDTSQFKDAPENSDVTNAVGLALSGGGIRSATFCLGVVQVLAERKLMRDIDVLSTVSGGGYTGSFLTTRLGNGPSYADVARPYGPDPQPVRYIRQHIKFLSAVDLKQGWSMVTATLAGMLLNWSAPLFMVTAAALFATVYKLNFNQVDWPTVLTVFGALTFVALISYGWLLRKGPRASSVGGWGLAITTALAALICVAALLDAGYDHVLKLWNAESGSHWALSGSLATAIAAALPAIQRYIPWFKNPTVREMVLKAGLFVAGILIPLGAIALFYVFWMFGTKVSYGAIILAAATVFSSAIAILLLNINLTGPHRLYRDQLALTFVHGGKNADEDEQSKAWIGKSKADTDTFKTYLDKFKAYINRSNPHIDLKDINPEGSAPYHIINAALNVPSSTKAALRDRKSDFFMFSKFWCGSPATGYWPTEDWRTNDLPPDLATAMAISGAAASPMMGLGSRPMLAALLTFLNVRLGFWIRRPDRPGLLKTPGFLCLIREMTGAGMTEKGPWLNLSDGGHIENMAIYELLRRRCKFIICVNGEHDPKFTFEGLMTLARHAQIDFGIRIDSNMGDLRPDPKTGHCQTHAAFCRIHYPDGAIGLLLYMSLSITGNESELIRRYRTLHPDFPHQSTFDLFYNEEQFEAYRQLGVHVADGLFAPALMSDGSRPMAETAEPVSVEDWFRRLARNLLRPLGNEPLSE